MVCLSEQFTLYYTTEVHRLVNKESCINAATWPAAWTSFTNVKPANAMHVAHAANVVNQENLTAAVNSFLW